jgi:AraC-like DNA-binding protein
MQPAFHDIVNIGPNCIERFIDNNNAPEIAHLDIELAGCSNLSGDYIVGRVTPPNHTLFYSLKGKGLFRTPAGIFTLNEGELIVLPAKQSFEVSIVEDNWDIFWLNLSDTPAWQSLSNKNTYIISHAALEGLHHAMELLYLERSGENRQAAMRIVSHYLRKLFDDVSPLQADAQLGKEDKQSVHYKRLTTLFSAVDRQLQFEWNMQSLSAKAHYSAPHLHRLCIKKYGRSPMQHVIFLRMQRARSLLKGTQWPISYIANYVGYANVFAFSKRFKKSVGMSPTQFREDVV